MNDFPALFRRAAITLSVGPLQSHEVAHYFRAFLRAFVSLEDAAWERWTQYLTLANTADCSWSIDSLQQYLMQQVRVAVERGLVERVNKSSSGDIRNKAWKVREGQVDAFLEMMVNPQMCSDHLNRYAVQY